MEKNTRLICKIPNKNSSNFTIVLVPFFMNKSLEVGMRSKKGQNYFDVVIEWPPVPLTIFRENPCAGCCTPLIFYDFNF